MEYFGCQWPSAESSGLVLGTFLGQDDCWAQTHTRHVSMVFLKNGQSSGWHSLTLFLPKQCNHLPSLVHCKIHQGLGNQPALSSTVCWLQLSQTLRHWAPQRGFQLSLNYRWILETAFQMIPLFSLTSFFNFFNFFFSLVGQSSAELHTRNWTIAPNSRFLQSIALW